MRACEGRGRGVLPLSQGVLDFSRAAFFLSFLALVMLVFPTRISSKTSGSSSLSFLASFTYCRLVEKSLAILASVVCVLRSSNPSSIC